MSWQQYIDNLLASKEVAKAAILGHNGAVWAASPGFQVSLLAHVTCHPMHGWQSYNVECMGFI